MYLLFGLSHLIFVKNIAGKSFIILEFFCYFFRNFFAWVEYERNSRLNFFFHLFSLSHPVLVKNNAKKGFSKFLSFFAIFFSEFSSSGRVWTEFGTKFFFFSFSAYLFPFWLKIILERGFLNFWILLLFFLEFSSPVRLWMEFGTKIFFFFFGLSIPVLAKNNTGKRFLIFWHFFSIFFGIFLPASTLNGIRD